MEASWLRSLAGIVILLFIAFLFSYSRKDINRKTVICAFALQFLFGALVLYVPMGKEILTAVSDTFSNILLYANEGIRFMFGPELGGRSLGIIFAFHVLPIIIFFSALISILYYTGIMGWVIRVLGGLLRKATGVSKPESFCSAANIFIGQAEAPLVVKPFLATMTRSQLFAVMVGGMSTVAGTVIAGLAGIGVELKYLIAASFMAAPGALLMAKIILPETEETVENLEDLKIQVDDSVNVFDAAAAGAAQGLILALNVGAMLIAFIALIALLNGLIGWVGGLVGYPEVSLQLMLGYVFKPIAFLIGIPWSEAQIAGSFLGQKLIINEFVAYLDFVNYKDQLSEMSQVIITISLCGFANVSSIGILIGGIGSLAENRRHELAELGLKTVFAATLANLMSATIAGFFVALSA